MIKPNLTHPFNSNKKSLETLVGKLLVSKQLTLSVAESCSGGLVSKRLTDIPGSSKYIKLNVVTYANTAKTNILNISQELLAKHGAVSSQCAQAMANAIRKLADTDIGLAITGIAGPGGGSKEKPVGLVFISLASKDGVVVQQENYSARLGRTGIRNNCADAALNMVLEYLTQLP